MKFIPFRFIIIIYFISLTTKSFSQKVNVAIEVRNNTNNPVSFATLNFLREKKQYVCNSNGKFNGIADKQDSLLISSVGFVDSIFYVEKLLNNPIVTLRQKVALMNEVVIKNGKKQLLGNLNLREDRSILGADSSSPSYEIAKLIKSNGVNNEFKILSVSFRQKYFYDSMPLILHIYTVDKDGLPGEDLLIDSQFLVKQEMHHKGIITIDVRSANVILNKKDFFVGLQILHTFDENLMKKDKWGFGMDGGIIETKKEPEALTFRRSSHFKNCWFTEYTTGFIIPKQKQYDKMNFIQDSPNLKPINIIAGVEIEVFEP